jgi:hypothetical protein
MVDWTEDAPVSRDPGLARAISSAMVRLYSGVAAELFFLDAPPDPANVG